MHSSSTSYQWLSLIGIIWLQSVSGTNTNFPAYSSQLKQLLSLSQIQLNNLAFASDAGKLFGFISGIASLYLPLWLVLLIGSVLGLIGYGVQYLFLTSYISSLSYAQIFLLTVIAGNSICWINTVCYLVCIRNFPLDTQIAVGLTTSYQGLSAKIYTVIVDALFSAFPEKKAKAYLLLNSVLPFLVSVLAAPFTNNFDVTKENCENMRVGFLVMFVITIATGIYSVISSFEVKEVENAIGIFVVLVSPILIPIWVKMGDILVPKNGESSTVHNLSMDIVESEVKLSDKIDEMESVKEEIGAKIMVKRVEFWLYFGIYLCGATLGILYLNNLGQIAESRGCKSTSSLVSLSSSFGFFGRLIPSFLDYFFSRSKRKIPRAVAIAALMAPMAGAFFLLVEKSNTSLYISTAVIGVCSGAITSISVSTTTDLFGTHNFSINHNLVVANIPFGSFLFGYLAALVYNTHENGDGKCIGTECYKYTFMLWGSLCFFGTLLALILYSRLRKLYSQI